MPEGKNRERELERRDSQGQNSGTGGVWQFGVCLAIRGLFGNYFGVGLAISGFTQGGLVVVVFLSKPY